MVILCHVKSTEGGWQRPPIISRPRESQKDHFLNRSLVGLDSQVSILSPPKVFQGFESQLKCHVLLVRVIGAVVDKLIGFDFNVRRIEVVLYQEDL